MSRNKQLVEKYMASMGRVDRAAVLSCLRDDVEWRIVTQGERVRGKAEFEQNIGTPPGVESVRIDITRMTEENSVVVAEGFVRMAKKDGGSTTFQFCDVFELEDGKVRRLTTFSAETKGPA